MREAKRTIFGILLYGGLFFLLLKAPEIYARTCPEDGSYTSNKDLSQSLIQRLAVRQGTDPSLLTAVWHGERYKIMKGADVVHNYVEFDKFSLWNPHKVDYPNHLFAFFVGNDFVIFDRCGNIVAAQG